MKIRLSEAENRLTLNFDDLDAARTFLTEASWQAAFLLHLESPLKQFERFEVVAKAPKRFAFTLTAEVVQVFPADNTTACAFGLCDWDEAAHKQLTERLQKAQDAPAASTAPAVDDDPNVSPIYRIQQMDVGQRLRLATKASRTERQILVRDSSPRVLLNLLSNPQTSDSEVRTIVASNYASAAIMQRIVKSKRWLGNPEILLALVRSPKTPPPIAIQHLSGLRTQDLKIVSKAGATREAVRRAALRIYSKRTADKRRV